MMWTLMPGQALRYHTWDGEAYVLYNDLSGDTHLLDGAAIEVLSVLRQQACGASALAQRLALAPEDLPGLTELLEELRDMALISLAAC